MGRPAFVTFMAVPHYAYLKLKMPVPAGTITVNGSFTQSDQLDHDFYKLSYSLGAQQELSEIAMVVDRSIFPLASRSDMKEITRDFSVDSDKTTHQVHPTDSEKIVRIYAHLPKDQTTSQLAFLRQQWEIFA